MKTYKLLGRYFSHLWLFAFFLIFTTSCSTSRYSVYQSSEIFQGHGGSVKKVNGVDIWGSGAPNCKFKILGVVDVTQHDTLNSSGFLSGMIQRSIQSSGLESDLIRQVKAHGGDGILLGQSGKSLSSISYYTTGTVTDYGGTGTGTVNANTFSNIKYDHQTQGYVIKYVEEQNVLETPRAIKTNEIDTQLLGNWESVSIKTSLSNLENPDKINLVFFTQHRVLFETILKSGKAEPRLNSYEIKGSQIEMCDFTVPGPHNKLICNFSLLNDQLIFTSKNVQAVFQKVANLKLTPDSDKILLGQWNSNIKTNLSSALLSFNFLSPSHYSSQYSYNQGTNLEKLTKNEIGIYSFDPENYLLVLWSDNEAKPELFKCYPVGDYMNVVVDKQSVEFIRKLKN